MNEEVRSCTIALTYDQREQVARDFLIEFLEDIEDVPFGDAILVEKVNQLIAYLSVPGEWEKGQHDVFV